MTDHDAIDEAARALPVELEPAKLEALISRVRRPRPVNHTPRWLALVAATLVAGVVTAHMLQTRGPNWLIVPSGKVVFRGQPLLQPERIDSKERWSLEVGAASSAQLVASNSVSLWLGENTRLSNADGFRLEEGALLATGDGVRLSAGDREIEVTGISLLLMEPADEAVRVTDVLAQFPSGERMKTKWLTLSGAAVGAGVGAGLTLFSIDGHATVAKDAPTIVVAAGQTWRSPETKTQISNAPSAQTRPSNPQLEAMTHAELVAMVEKISDEKEALLRQREELKKKIEVVGETAPRAKNYYHLTSDELAESAKKGEVHWRGPQFSDDEFKINPKVVANEGLTPDEEAKIKAIYQASAERLHTGLLDAYGQLGGDKNAAAAFSSGTLLEEIRSKALRQDYEDSVRQVANERAGLVQANLGSGSPVVRAYRLLADEDERVINEVETVIGPRRAEAFLNDKALAHGDHVDGVGPPKPQ